MSTFGNVLSSARTAIATTQAAMQTVSHNIANAQTEGYSRQRVELASAWPLILPFGSLGVGVEITDVTRMRDSLLDASFRRETTTAEAYGMRQDLLSEIEGILNEPSDSGLSAAMDAFWNSWSDLSNNPGNPVMQGVVRQRGAEVTHMFTSYASRLDELVNRTRDRLGQTVNEVNTLASQLAKLNEQVVAAEASGNQAPDLRDKRDLIADQLAKLGVARAEYQGDGSLNVYIGGVAIVGGNVAHALELRGGTTVQIARVGDPEALNGVTGPLAAMTDFINSDAPGIRAKLDELARGLVNGVNEYHASGWTAAGDALGNSNWNPLSGPTGSRVNFFDAAGTTAATMQLSAEVLADAAVIASGDVQNAPGNNAIALAIAALRDDSGMDALRTRMGAAFATQIGFAPGITYGEHYTQTVADLGVQTSDAASQHDVYSTLAASADHRRTSVAGVSIDEELTKLMQFQQGYVAATRVVSAVQSMMDSLVQMV